MTSITYPAGGHADLGGPVLLRVVDGIEIRKAAVSEQANNAYLITSRRTGAQILVDAADSAPQLLDIVGQGSPTSRLDLVVTTHQHWDHHRALPDVVAATGASTAAGREDAAELPLAVDRLLDHGDRIEVEDLVLDVVHLRGHTPGSVALVLRPGDGSTHLFTGDSLFPGGVGNTWGDADRFTSLLDDVEQRIFAVLPDDTVVYPGHGDDTTLGAERGQLGAWRERGW